MAKYKIYFKKSAVKEIKQIPKSDLERVIKRIHALCENPRPHGAEKLSDGERYRLRQGNYRIVYYIEDQNYFVCIVKIGHRREVYKKI